jgi:glucose-6-phosphate isomerase
VDGQENEGGILMSNGATVFTGSSYSFTGSSAAERLREFADSPFDLKEVDGERLKRMAARGCGFKLLFGMQKVTEGVMEALWGLAEEANVFEKMEALQAGEVINFIEGYESEHRSVLHTAVRDFFEHPNMAPRAKGATAAAKREFDKLAAFMDKIDGKFTDLVCVGIGGSELGPKTLYYGLQGHARPDRKIHFVSNVDPDDAAQVLRGLNLSKTLVVSVSKSGGTLETKTNEDLVRHHFEQAGLSTGEHFIAATGEGSPMDDPNRYLERFYVWDWVGGRYCATSVIGGIVLAFAYGTDVYQELLRGAHEMDRLALERDRKKNLPLLMALLGIWNRNFLGYPTLAVIPYSQMLVRFAAHIQQVDMESDGKRIDRRGEAVDFHTGPIVWGEPATNAQHSFFQLIHQGTHDIPLEFIGFRQTQMGDDLEQEGITSQEKLVANLFAQALALATGQESTNPNKVFPGGRPSSILLAEQLTPYALGALLALYEHKIAFQGFIWNINSFDQEGVQLGKVLANQIIERIGGRKKGTGKPHPLGDPLLDHLESL